MTSALRVFQVASGNVGAEMIKRITRHRDLELVGLHCYSADKIGWYRLPTGSVGAAAVGMTVTGMPALNAIPAVVNAPPGAVTGADLPLRAFAGRFAR